MVAAGTQQKRWGSIAWWIIVCISVPFSIYTLPFAMGKYAIFKYLTATAGFGNLEGSGLHILRNLRTWQAHATSALAYIAIGPFQFNPSWRNKHMVAHRRLGYVFALATVVTAVTGSTTMTQDSELGPIALGLAKVMGPLCLVALVISINAARNKNVQSHRRWMTRSASIGYAVTFTRIYPPIIGALLKVQPMQALDYSFLVAWFSNIAASELFIQTYLTQVDEKRVVRTADDVKKAL